MSSTLKSSGIASYPSHQIDPRDKGFEWIKSYTQAAYRDSTGYSPYGMFSNRSGSLRMAEIKMYGLGKQPVDKYKKILSPSNPTDPSWRAVSWEVPAFLCKYREIAISKILQKRFDIEAFAVDALAKSEEDAYFNQMKVKIMVRDMLQQSGSELANAPAVQKQEGEPEDAEQLRMQQEDGYKHVMAEESELAAQLVFQQNEMEIKRRRVVESLIDYGLGGFTQDIDENGQVKLRDLNIEYLGLSYCEKPDFSDLVHWFEVVPTYVGDLVPYYTKEQLDEICKLALDKNGNPNTYVSVNGIYNPAWSRFKVMVCHIKFLSWNESVYKEEMDSRGNVRFGKTAYQNKQFLSVNSDGELKTEGGSATPKYMNDTQKVVYKASWIVDTDYMHNWGLKENQSRKYSCWWDTHLDIQLFAWSFYKMQYGGITERLIPIEDRACMAWFNLQNLSNKLIPYLINIDFNAVENVNFGKNGKKADPKEIIDFIFSNFVVPFRSSDLLSRNPNYKPVSIEATGQLAAFGQLYDELNHCLNMMQQISGLNELTDGSTPDSKTLVPVAQSAIQSTNNALYLISEADKYLQRKTADAVIQKVQIAVKLGKVEGYVKSLGMDTVKFLSINPDISLYELGIFISDAPSDLERQQLWQDINMKESQGFLTPADKYFIMTCRNLKQAVRILDYKIKKRKEEAHLQQMQLNDQQAQNNQQLAMTAEELKRETMQMQGQLDIQKIIIEKEYDMKIEQMKKGFDLEGEMHQVEGRTIGHAIQAESKIRAAEIAAEAMKVKAKKPVSK